MRLPRMRSHTFVHTYSHPPPNTCYGFSPGPANHKSKTSHDDANDDDFKEFGPQVGSACAFKWDLNAKVDESKGILLPIHGILLFCKQNEHPRVDFGSAETRFWSPFGAPAAVRMHSDTSVFLRKSEVSKGLGHK